jgi:hypothetical protein
VESVAIAIRWDRPVRNAARMRRLIIVLSCLWILAGSALLAGCGSSGGASTSSTTGTGAGRGGEASASAQRAPTERIERSVAASGRVAGSAALPAAGVCPAPGSSVVTIALMTDVPAPRCVRVRSDQHLRVANETQALNGTPRVAHLHFAGFRATIAPGHAVLLDEPLGRFLTPGTFAVEVAPAPGPIALRLLRAGQ